MSFLGSALPAVIGAVGDIASGFLGNMFSSAAEGDAFSNAASLQRAQYLQNVEAYQHRHRWEVTDLIKAGLNPILSAQNSAGSVAGSGIPSMNIRKTPDFDISKAANAMANSALVQKQTKLAEYNSHTERIKAEADMLRARLEEQKTPSAIDVNRSQAELNFKNIDILEKNYNLNKLYKEAEVREIDQRIINATMETMAKIQYYKDLGSAAQTSAQAALSSAHAQQIIAQTAEANGVSQRALNDVLQGKADAETKEAAQRLANLAQTNALREAQNPISTGHHELTAENILMGLGEVVRNGIGGVIP